MKVVFDLEGRQIAIPKRQFVNTAVPLFRACIEDAVRLGVIDPKGKDKDQIAEEIFKFIGRIGESTRFLCSTDHTSDLLDEARRCVQIGKQQIACLLYATWLEHWMNALIADLARRRRFQDTEISAILRDIPYKAKPTWFLRLLGFPPLSGKHVRTILDIGELRNSFVHYKWKQHDVDSDDFNNEPERISRLLKQAEFAIRYLRSVERKYFFGRKKRHWFVTKRLTHKLIAENGRQHAGLARSK